MKQIAKFITIAMVVSFYAACSKVAFEQDSDCGPGCVRVEGNKVLEYTVTVTGGKVDILFVDDNSGSMSFEQNHIANRFNSFISSLDAQALDYRIAITTTDVGNANTKSPVKNGALVTFSNGQNFLTKDTANKESLFAAGIQRQETLQCETNLRAGRNSVSDCPSADERGIYAANMTVEANPSSFIRGDAHLAIVFLSDEDVRSGLYEYPSYKLAGRDLPQTLIQTVRDRYAGKSLSMHSIIVKPGNITGGLSAADVAVRVAQVVSATNQVNESNKPERFFSGGDTQCLAAQSNQVTTPSGISVTGSYGYLYYLAAKMTGGVVGDICSNNYANELRDIAENVGGKTQGIGLACENPEILELRYVGESGTPPGQVENGTFVFGDSIPLGKTVYLKIQCPEL